MQASAEHVQYQLPNEHSRVGFLLEAIQCSDPGLQATVDKREDQHKFHQLWILPLTPLRSQALGKLGFTFVTTRLVNTGTLQMSKRRN